MLTPSLMIASTVLCYAERAAKYFLMRQDKTTYLLPCVCTYAPAYCSTNPSILSCLPSEAQDFLSSLCPSFFTTFSPYLTHNLLFLLLLVTFSFPCQCMTAVPSSPHPHHCPSPPSILTLSCQSSEAEGSLSKALNRQADLI